VTAICRGSKVLLSLNRLTTHRALVSRFLRRDLAPVRKALLKRLGVVCSLRDDERCGTPTRVSTAFGTYRRQAQLRPFVTVVALSAENWKHAVPGAFTAWEKTTCSGGRYRPTQTPRTKTKRD